MNPIDDETRTLLTRRRFLAGTAAASAASFLGFPLTAAADPPPEVKKIRLPHAPIACLAPQYVAEELLHSEGFTQVEYVPGADRTETGPVAVAAGKVDLAMWDAFDYLRLLDAGEPLAVLAGVHAGCWELIASERVRSLRDLKGKTVAIWGIGHGDHMLLASMLKYIGMNPNKDVNWLPGEDFDAPMRLFLSGKADAFMGFAPQPQELRAKGTSARVLINTAQDRPWAQYFCCMISTNRKFLQQNPVATKRAVRAILKAADICAREPAQAARYMAAKGYEPRYELGAEVITELPYRRWRDSNPEDTLRFYGLRLYEVGMIKSSPEKIIARGTDWRILNELRKELKA